MRLNKINTQLQRISNPDKNHHRHRLPDLPAFRRFHPKGRTIAAVRPNCNNATVENGHFFPEKGFKRSRQRPYSAMPASVLRHSRKPVGISRSWPCIRRLPAYGGGADRLYPGGGPGRGPRWTRFPLFRRIPRGPCLLPFPSAWPLPPRGRLPSWGRQ